MTTFCRFYFSDLIINLLRRSQVRHRSHLIFGFTLVLLLSLHLIGIRCSKIPIQNPQIPLFEAAFQGECRKSNLCQQLCFDLHDGTFECACNQRYQLDVNGYSCLKYNQTATSFITSSSFYNQVTVTGQLSNDHHRSIKLSTEAPPEKNDAINKIEASTPSSRTAIASGTQFFYSCDDVECEAGGVCIGDNEIAHDNDINSKRVRCRCPLGRGGQFCEKIIEVKTPHFRGTSYLALPTLRSAHRSLQLSIEFKPQSFDGILLYSGQEPNLDGDFIAVVINQGFVEFRFDCGMGEGTIRSDMPVLVNAWNTLNIFRDGRNAWMQLNQGQQMFGHSKGLFSRITFRLEMFLGGSPNISQIADRVHTKHGMLGCVRALQINERNYDFYRDTIDGIDIDQCNSDACNQVACLNGGHCALNEDNQGMCICLLGFTGEFCEIETEFLIPSFNGSSHLQFIGFGEQAVMFSEIIVVIKPDKPDGLFLYNGQKMDRTGDFISLNLVKGYVEFRFDLGSGAAVIRSPKPIRLHEWHTIYAARTGREGILAIDHQPYSIGMSLGAFTQLSLPLNLYIGGVPSLRDIHQNVQSPKMFSGCIQRVVVNGRQLSLSNDVLSGINIGNCQHVCSSESPCRNGGICEPLENRYQCRCANYIGTHCEQEIAKDIPMFFGNSFLQYTDSTIIDKLTGFKMAIKLRLRAFSSNGLIIWLGDLYGTNADFFSAGLRNGHLNIDIKLGKNEHKLTFNVTRIDDGQWHELDILRIARQISVRINRSAAIHQEITPDRLITKDFYLGGLEDTTLQTQGAFQKGFIGCISQMLIGEQNINIVSRSESGINIRTCI